MEENRVNQLIRLHNFYRMKSKTIFDSNMNTYEDNIDTKMICELLENVSWTLSDCLSILYSILFPKNRFDREKTDEEILDIIGEELDFFSEKYQEAGNEFTKNGYCERFKIET